MTSPSVVASVEVTQGDTSVPLIATLCNPDGTPVNLSPGGTTVSFQMVPATGGAPLALTGVLTVTNPAAGVVSYAWGFADVSAPGEYIAQFLATIPGVCTSKPYPDGGISVVITPLLSGLPGPDQGPFAPWTDPGRVLALNAQLQGDLTMAIRSASEKLYWWSGRQFPGLATFTIRPTHSASCSCGCGAGGGTYWALGGAFWGSWGGAGRLGGWSGQVSVPTIRLGSNVRSIVSISIDGAVVDPSTYTFYRRSGELIRNTVVQPNGTAGANPGWPYAPIDNPSLPLSAQGTFGITVQFGADVPASGVMAATELAAAEAAGGVTNLVNAKSLGQGVARTGLLMVDYFLNSINPRGLQRNARIYSPDRPPHRVVG